MSNAKAEVPYGTLDLVILKTLDTMGGMHGYSIARRIEQVADNLLHMSQGSIYPGVDSPRTARLDPHAVGRLGDQPQGQGLLADGSWQTQVAHRSGELGAGDGTRRQIPGIEIVTPLPLLRRLLALLRSRRFDRELESEIQAHLELAERDAIARGPEPGGRPSCGTPCLRQYRAHQGRTPRSAKCAVDRNAGRRTFATGCCCCAAIPALRSSPSASWRSASAPTRRCSASWMRCC